jgi:hypothetical protein
MRTTLTIDGDVAVRLERLQRERDTSLKQLVNDALRQGLNQLEAKQKPRKPFRMRTFDGGKPLVPLDNIAETLAMIEGEDYK